MTTEYPNSIFYHLPKTGGTWVSNIFKEAGVKGRRIIVQNDSDTHYLMEHTPPVPRDKFSFTIWRNPTDWHISLFTHLQKVNWAFLKQLKADTFIEYLEKCKEHYPEGLAYRYMQDFKDVDLILRTENLTEDILPILEREGIDTNVINTPKANVGNKKPIDHRTLRKLQDYESKALELWYNNKIEH